MTTEDDRREAKSAFSRVTVTRPQLGQVVPIPRLELEVEREDGRASGRTVVVDGELCRIGSHPSNDLVLQDPTVSRFHCRLARGSEAWSISDTGSLNGTFVSGVRVREADLPMPECRLGLGQSVVRIRELGSGASAPVPVWPSFGAVAGTSLPMRRLFATLARVTKTDATLLIEGESGTGKEIIANEIVRLGPRSGKPFVVVDCGAISPTLIESELFGHVRGAFTGADRDRIGAFEAADGGTVLLDEIGEMPIAMQPKLLRALETKEIRRLGDNRTRKVDVRVIAATNRRLEREVNHARFREDLYFRLSVVTVRVPPLRDRLDDIPILINVFLKTLMAEERSDLFTNDVLADLARYDWPGNVRELRNYVERAVVLDTAPPASRRGSSPSVEVELGSTSKANLDLSFREAKEQVVTSFEQDYVAALLQWADGNVSMAARKAGMDRMYLHRLVQRYGLKAKR